MSIRYAAFPLSCRERRARGGGEFGGDGTGLQGVGLFASWELDLWGRVRAVTRAAETQYESARLDAGYARQSLSALVTKGWVLAIEARLQKARAAEMEKAAEGLAALADDRLRVGVGDDYEVALAQANLESFRDTVRNLDLAYQNALRALETLVGRHPEAAVAVADALPTWPGDVPVGLPSELLERRPDVVAAERRIATAFYRTEEAKAARLPRITLVANVTTISSELLVLKNRDDPVFSGRRESVATDLSRRLSAIPGRCPHRRTAGRDRRLRPGQGQGVR